jgi:hypothetical protein
MEIDNNPAPKAEDPSLNRRVLHVHIGRLKTGTTSFQNFLHEHRTELEEVGVGLFETQISLDENVGRVSSWAHEIPLAFLRPDFEYALKMLTKERNFNVEQLVKVISSNLKSNKPYLIASHEALSFVRNQSELLPLKKMADEAGRDVRVYLVLRERESWTESYKGTFASLFEPLPTRDSFGYLEKDSWLFDNENLLDVYEDVFGKGAVTLINYETILRTRGEICVALLDSMQLPKQMRTLRPTRWLNASKDKARGNDEFSNLNPEEGDG